MSEICSCEKDEKLIFACSGAADVGELTDRAARKITAEKAGKMFCTAGIGGQVVGILKTAREAPGIVALDGCSVNCVAKSLKKAGFEDFIHISLGEHGYVKGKTTVNDSEIEKVKEKIKEIIS